MGATLLIVDDHAGFRSFARALMEEEGFHVVGEAGDGVGAIAEVRRLRPEIVLLDVVLPDLDGFAVCAAIMAGGDRPAVVLTSSRDAGTYRERLDASSACGFIPKSDLTGAALAALTGT